MKTKRSGRFADLNWRHSLMLAAVCLLGPPSLSLGAIIVSQTPVPGGGVSRWSQLWQDPGPGGNDLDSDAICWADFTVPRATLITHIEWWGTGACELGFQIEFWPQDPGTIAYQPLAVFDRSPGPSPVTPTARFIVEPTDYTIDATPDGLTHFSLDLAAPVALAANDRSNPRWFIGVIGLTHAYATWNWSQGTGGSTRTFQWNRGDANNFRSLGDGRALMLADAGPEPLPQLNISASSNGALVSWTTNAVGFVLQENFDCASGNWVNVTNAVSVVDGEYCVTIPIFPTRNNFFRLIRP